MAEPIDIDSLFALPLEEFTAARNTLAGRLAGKGDKTGAANVKGLRKPSVTAWAVNQLAHSHARDIKRLLDATDAVQNAGDASALRRTTAARTKILSGLVDAARDILEDAGRAATGTQLDKITQTLQAASTSDDHKDDLVHGRLQQDLEPTGWADVVAFAPQEPAEDQPSRAAKRKADQLVKKASAAEERAAKLVSRAEQLEELAAEARKAADEALAGAREARARADEALQPG
jgi:hypothetical protein